jgi:hypothetical protein
MAKSTGPATVSPIPGTDDWKVTGAQDDGTPHEAKFIGGDAKARALVHADANFAQVVIAPG